MSAETFADRFIRRMEQTGFTQDPDHGIAIKHAVWVLKGVAREFIPYKVCERRRFIVVRDLGLLACCLDDYEIGAKPGCISAMQLYCAWKAAGQERFIKALVANHILEQAHFAAISANPWIIEAKLFGRR